RDASEREQDGERDDDRGRAPDRDARRARRQGATLPGFRIPDGSSAAFTRRRTSSPASPCSRSIRCASCQPTPWQYSIVPPASCAARQTPSIVSRTPAAASAGPVTTTE